ncbi:MAG: ATPase [Bacteroidaceae bacterium]|nr:ATPase [Bacteroidaceae bacterium]
MKLIVDSGSTKTAWQCGGNTAVTAGLNPVRDSVEQMQQVIDQVNFTGVTEVFFYGAGCIPPYAVHLERLLQAKYPTASVLVASDMLGAARALCGHHEGIACILGTGSNSCLYDGTDIVQNVSPLGYILGDEGSGAVLGRTLVGDLLKEQLPDHLRDAFFLEMPLTPNLIIENVYRRPMPNRFLASLVPFIARHAEEPGLHELLVGCFRAFFRRNVALYRRPDLPVHFVGGVANQFAMQLREAAASEGFAVGDILKSPIDKMVLYHAFSS